MERPAPANPSSAQTSRGLRTGTGSPAHPKEEESLPKNPPEAAIVRFLRAFQSLLVASRLYQKNHTLAASALEAADLFLRAALQHTSPLAVGIEVEAMVYCPSKNAPPVALQKKSSWAGIAEDWARRGITSVTFLPQTNIGELDSFARLLNESRTNNPDEWPARLAAQDISGIRVNVPLRQRPGTVLAALVSVLVSQGGGPMDTPRAVATAAPATLEDLGAALRLLARFAPIVTAAASSTPQETADALHMAASDAEQRTVNQLVGTMSRHIAHENEPNDKYLARLSEAMVMETLSAQFVAGRLAAADVRGVFTSLGDALAQSMRAPHDESEVTTQGSLLPATMLRAARALLQNLPEHQPNAAEGYIEHLHETFWERVPARERAAVLRGDDAWCVPVSVLSSGIARLLEAGRIGQGDAPIRESRIVIVNFSRGLKSERAQTRRTVANGLSEMLPLIELLWHEETPSELARAALRALAAETSPGISAQLCSLVENLAQLALGRSDYGEFERILMALQESPRDSAHAHVFQLCETLMADANWSLLVNAAVTARPGMPVDPALPRTLARDPDRLLDSLGVILAVPDGLNTLPALTALVRAAGEPVIGTLETHLLDPRRQRAGTAIKLLAATKPQRLVDALPRALPGWDWNLQDLAVAELTRDDAVLKPEGVAREFAAVLSEADPLVAPVMIDEIAMTGETSAIPLLCEIASGSIQRLRDVFIRIKAIEALGALHATSAAGLLRGLLRHRAGLVHTEPAGLRAAAVEAIALMENHPASARVRAAREAAVQASVSFVRPRRYMRIPLHRPMSARIENRSIAQMEAPLRKAAAAAVRVRTISLGGAFVESTRGLAVGDHLCLDIRAGLRHIHSTAVVRNVSATGGGVEFLHMTEESRERLRKLVRRLLA
jgi:hypothetical protein